jgi:predicted secreted protein
MTTLAKIGWGATFSLHNGTTLVPLAEIIAIGMPNAQVDTVEATHFGSAGAYREYIAGLIEAGDGEFGMNLANGSVSDLLCKSTRDGRIVRAYEISIPSVSGTWEVTGNVLVTGYERDVPIDDRMTCVLSCKFTGPPVEAAGV